MKSCAHATKTRNLAVLLMLTSSVASASQLKLQQLGMALTFETSTMSSELSDLKTASVWDLGVPSALYKNGKELPLRADSVTQSTATSFTYHDNTGNIDISVQLVSHPLPCIEYSVSGLTEASPIRYVSLVESALSIVSSNGYYAVPKGLGIQVIPSGPAALHRIYSAYRVGNGYSMAMFGAVKDGSALLVDWDTPYIDIATDYLPQPTPRLNASFVLHPGAQHFQIAPLGRGTYVEIAKAYRTIAQERSLFKTVAQQAVVGTKSEKLIGAAEFKPLAYVRRKAKDGSGNVTINVFTTFPEIARLAEHLKNEVGVDRAMMIVSGWSQAGYDSQLPTILPAAAPAGGNPGLQDCSRRIKALGWLFGLHDNYQDMYQDSPDFNSADIVKKQDGSLMKGGVWAGGQAYFICSRASTQLISRPQNLPEVEELFGPDVYFLDTVFASPLRACFDSVHPTTLADDMEYRQRLCDYVRQQKILLGTEEGNEQGVAHSDYFEGMLSQKTRSHAPNADTVIPLFALVYADGIKLLTHQSDKLQPENAAQFLDHILYAQMPIYFTPQHEYWGKAQQPYHGAAGTKPEQLVFSQGVTAQSTFDTFIRNTYEVLSPLVRSISDLPMTDHQYLKADRSVEMTRFGTSTTIYVNYGASEYIDGDVDLPEYGFVVSSPEFIAVYARQFRALHFKVPTLLTVRATDDRPLTQSHKIRLFRAFGDEQITVRGKTVSVNTVAMLAPD